MSSIQSDLTQISQMWAGYHTNQSNGEMRELRRQALDRAEVLVQNIPMISGYGGLRISDDGTIETTGYYHDGVDMIYDPELHAEVDKRLRGDDKLSEILQRIGEYEYHEHKAPEPSGASSPLQQLDENGNPVEPNTADVLARMQANASKFQRPFLDDKMITFSTGENVANQPPSEHFSTTISSGGKQVTSPAGDTATISAEAVALQQEQSKADTGNKNAHSDPASSPLAKAQQLLRDLHQKAKHTTEPQKAYTVRWAGRRAFNPGADSLASLLSRMEKTSGEESK